MNNKQWNYNNFISGLNIYKNNYQQDIFAAIYVWIPTQFVTFAILPMHWRVPWLNAINFLWLGGLSFFRGGSSTKESTNNDNIAQNTTVKNTVKQ